MLVLKNETPKAPAKKKIPNIELGNIKSKIASEALLFQPSIVLHCLSVDALDETQVNCEIVYCNGDHWCYYICAHFSTNSFALIIHLHT